MIFKLISVIDGWCISCEIAPKWMPLDLTNDKSALVHVIAWCRQATSHYPSQCIPRSLSPYGVTRPQCVNISWQIIGLNWLDINNHTTHHMHTWPDFALLEEQLWRNNWQASGVLLPLEYMCNWQQPGCSVTTTGFTPAKWVTKSVCTDTSLCSYW